MKRIVCSIISILIYAWFAGVSSASVLLVEKGKTKSIIVIADKPSGTAKKAAGILQEYIEKISGARLDIKSEKDAGSQTRILVGQSETVKKLGINVPSGFTYQMNEEGFVIKTIGNSLVLAGNEDWRYRGTEYAVYDFLEELGCRWFFPGPYGEVIPSVDTIEVDNLDIEEHPSFRFRNIWYAGWMPVTSEDGKNMSRWYGFNKLGALPSRMPADGSIKLLAPAEKYFETHPHIYAMDKSGNRVKDMLCLTEPDAVRIGVNTILDYFKNNPGACSFAFAPPDGWPVCWCDKCKERMTYFTGKGYGDPSVSDSWFQFANRIATEVYKVYPDRWLFTNGYTNRVRLPENIIEFSPNLGIQFAMFTTCTLHRIGDPRCWQRVLYKKILDRWTEKLNCVFIYDYDPGKALDSLPATSLINLKNDLPYFHKRGVWGFWTEGHNSWMVTHLNYYIRGKLMWNVEEDVDALVRDYCEKFYGRAADAMEDYIWTLEKTINNSTIHPHWGMLIPWNDILTPNVMRKLDSLIEKAQRRAQSPEAKLHMKVFTLVHEHMSDYLDMEQAASDGDFRKAAEHADRMLSIRLKVSNIAKGLLPKTPEFYSNHSFTIEGIKKMYAELADKAGGEKGKLVVLLPESWEFKRDPEDIGVIYQWYSPKKSGPWGKIKTTAYWQAQGYQDEKGWGYYGKAWYRTGVYVPPDAKDKTLILTLGGVYNSGIWIWINGILVKYLQNQRDIEPFEIDVTGSIRPGETNTIAVLVNMTTEGSDIRGGLHRRVFLWNPR